MNIDWAARERRLNAIVSGADVVASHRMVKEVRLPSAGFSRLEGAVIAYVWHSLSAAFPDRMFAPASTVLADYEDAVDELPNRTPNGVLLPRRETFLSFNLIHQALTSLLETIGLGDKFSLAQVPCNVRIVSGRSSDEAERRPHSSAKLHTDVWAGEPISSVLFNIPVLGDTDAADMRFFEPAIFPHRLLVPLADYDLGQEITSCGTECPLKLQLGMAYLSDALSLHRTVKNKPGLRLSIDFRLIAGELLPEETADCSTSRAIYIPWSRWRFLGGTTILTNGEPLDAYQRRVRGDDLENTVFSLLSIDESYD